MKSKSLIETNPYLKDPVMRDRLVRRSVRTSCGVEGIKAPEVEVEHACSTVEEFMERMHATMRLIDEKQIELCKTREEFSKLLIETMKKVVAERNGN